MSVTLYVCCRVCPFLSALYSSLQASFVYKFRPSESFYARPFGLVINVYYKDAVCGTIYTCQKLFQSSATNDLVISLSLSLSPSLCSLLLSLFPSLLLLSLSPPSPLPLPLPLPLSLPLPLPLPHPLPLSLPPSLSSPFPSSPSPSLSSSHSPLQDGNDYRDAVFNNTVNIVEVEEGFDAET